MRRYKPTECNISSDERSEYTRYEIGNGFYPLLFLNVANDLIRVFQRCKFSAKNDWNTQMNLANIYIFTETESYVRRTRVKCEL